MTQEEPYFTPDSSPGKRLKAKRIELGISLEEISNALLIPVGSLGALEDDRYEELPGLTYIVGYWRSYANILDIDISDEIGIHKNRLQSSNVLAAYHVEQHTDVHQKKSRKGSVILFVLLFAGFLAGLWYWQKPADRPFPIQGNNAADDAATAPVLLLPEPGEPVLPVDTPPPAEVSGGTLSVPGDQSGLSVGAQGAPASGTEANIRGTERGPDQESGADSGDSGLFADRQSEPPVSQEAPSVPDDQSGSSADDREAAASGAAANIQEAEQVSSSAEEVFRAGGVYDPDSPEWLRVNVNKTTWIDIRDGREEKLVFRTVDAGENLQINGLPPFYVFIGSLDGVEVFYLGESVDVSPHSSGLSSRSVVGKYPKPPAN